MIPMQGFAEQNGGGLKGAIFVAVFLAVFSVAGLRLFWPQETQRVVQSVKNFVGFGAEKSQSGELLTVIFPDESRSLDPFSLDASSRLRLNNIYDPLVKLDADLKSFPGLSVSWGMLDDLTWQFNLRSGVVFHDGTAFDAGDVLKTFELAQDGEGEISSLLDSIVSVERVDDFRVEIKTSKPDPLLVQRIAKVLIVPSEWTGEGVVGTGAYKLAKFESGKEMELVVNENYWADRPFYEKVKILSIADKSKRVNTFLTNTVDLLTFVSYDAADIVKGRGFNLAAVPSLEVQFLLFNLKSDFFKSIDARKALNMAIDKEALVRSVGGYAKSAKQFVGSGVFGFNSEIEGYDYDLEFAKKLIADSKLTGVTLQLHLQKGLDVVGEHLRQQLADVGVKLVVSYLEPEALQNSVSERKADIYFLGFKSDFADSVDLFAALFAEGASDNISSYESEEFNLFLAEAQKELKPDVRINFLKQAMNEITMRDIVGVPLFEYENLYGFKQNLDFKPRIDGQIYFEDIKQK